MEIILVLHIGFLLSLAIARPNRPCGCKPVFEFCANDHHTYHSICEYKCRHPSTPFQDWFILYHGSCFEMSDFSETITKRSLVPTTATSGGSNEGHKDQDLHDTSPDSKCGAKVQGYEWEPRTGSCYKFHPLVRGWSNAKASCQDEGGHLAIINSDTESTVLKEFFEKNEIYRDGAVWDWDHAYIGFEKLSDGKWVTINGETLAEAGFNRWAANEPNNSRGEEDCGSIRGGLHNDLFCNNYPVPYICEITPKFNQQ
ncbi:hemolymph lipopolysaccharide-binding protein-like [Leguminivora glycinivorella]|uniref:hemolymph lipopolysaccharide-binding protein-like n=1 Tax=Leguminivora glycinivorella TaxID=1035111 RepID=UPI00200C43CE|nr:hemolymph lipopolysaccharide-binding protein-like [Leguminivora glycinivorella]